MSKEFKWTEDKVIEQLSKLNKVYVREIERESKKDRRRVEYICSCGRRKVGELRHVLWQEGCMECLHERRREPFDQVKQAFDSIGLILFSDESDYENSNSLLQCSCPKCGWVGTTRYSYVHEGCRPCLCPDIELSE